MPLPRNAGEPVPPPLRRDRRVLWAPPSPHGRHLAFTSYLGHPERMDDRLRLLCIGSASPCLRVKTHRILGRVLSDGSRRAVVSLDLRGHETPEWLLTSYERPAPATAALARPRRVLDRLPQNQGAHQFLWLEEIMAERNLSVDHVAILLGEQVAVSVFQDRAMSYNEQLTSRSRNSTAQRQR